MKATRKIFVVTGKGAVVRNVLSALVGFKATTVFFDSVGYGSVLDVFKNNKSAIFSEESANFPLDGLSVVRVIATDTKTMIYGSNDIVNTNGNVVRQFMEIADSHGIDIGDHVSNASMGSSKSDCVFCRLLAGNPVHEQASLYESENFLVIPGSGAFLDGYLMILPKEHVMSCAELPVEQQDEMAMVIEDVKSILRGIYKKDVLVWENGSGQGGKNKPKTSIVHAHVHVCPSSINVVETTRATGIPIYPINYCDLQKYCANAYLLIKDYDGRWYISYDQNLYIPRQYMRQLIAMEHNIYGDLWNWREYPFWDDVERTGNQFLSYVKENWESLSLRIKKATGKFVE